MRIAVRHEEFHPERTLICSSQRERPHVVSSGSSELDKGLSAPRKILTCFHGRTVRACLAAANNVSRILAMEP
jgi:hypothetical protein